MGDGDSEVVSAAEAQQEFSGDTSQERLSSLCLRLEAGDFEALVVGLEITRPTRNLSGRVPLGESLQAGVRVHGPEAALDCALDLDDSWERDLIRGNVAQALARQGKSDLAREVISQMETSRKRVWSDAVEAATAV
jgi:hypothetical protein